MHTVSIMSFCEDDPIKEIYSLLCKDCLVRPKCLHWGHFSFYGEKIIYQERGRSIWSHDACEKLVRQVETLPKELTGNVAIKVDGIYV